MNLKSIYLICKECIEAIEDLNATSFTRTGQVYYTVTNWIGARDVALKLKEIPFFEENAENILSAVPEIFINKDKFDMNSNEWGYLSENRKLIYEDMYAVIRLNESMGVEQVNEVGFEVKLPPFQDLEEFSKYVQDIDFIFTKCPFLQDNSEKIQFQNVDVGSTWLTFILLGTVGVDAGSRILNNLASFIDKCLIIKSHKLSIEKQKADLEASKKAQNEKEIIQTYLDDQYKAAVRVAIKELEKSSKKEINNEDGDAFGRIERSIDIMNNLLDKGMQIKASIDAPKEAKLLFEPLEMKYIEKSKAIEKIEEKKSDVAID